MYRLMRAGIGFRGVGLAAAAICLLAGCGGAGGGNHVSGTVTFAGNPIPAGKIYFSPDGSKDNSGATGYANIVNGKYDTAAEGGKPHAGGAMIVRIEGLDPARKTTDAAGEVLVQPLFPTYETTVELSTETTTKDFDVPAAAAKRKDRLEGSENVP